MHRVLDMLQGELPPTAAYARRAWLWLPADPGGPGWDGRSGTLRVALQASRRPGAKVQSDLYAVEEEDAVGCMGRSFLLLNLSDPDQDEVYRCLVGGPHEHCTCKAALCRLGCKHRDALRAVLEAGGLAEPLITGA